MNPTHSSGRPRDGASPQGKAASRKGGLPKGGGITVSGRAGISGVSSPAGEPETGGRFRERLPKAAGGPVRREGGSGLAHAEGLDAGGVPGEAGGGTPEGVWGREAAGPKRSGEAVPAAEEGGSSLRPGLGEAAETGAQAPGTEGETAGQAAPLSRERRQLWNDIRRMEQRREALYRLYRMTGSSGLQQRADNLAPLLRNLYDQLSLLAKSESCRPRYVRPKGGIY